MRKVIAIGILLMLACLNAKSQDTSKVETKKLPPDVKVLGPYIVTMDNGKISVAKNPDYDTSKVLKRDTSFRSRWDNGIIEIYAAGSATPVIKKYFVYDLTAVSSNRGMSKEERMAKYNSRKGVLVVHLKPGVVPINEIELLSKFNIPQKDYNLPLYIDYEPVLSPDEFQAIPEAVLKIEVITDRDGFQFLNITTKDWDAMEKKWAGKDVIWLR